MRKGLGLVDLLENEWQIAWGVRKGLLRWMIIKGLMERGLAEKKEMCKKKKNKYGEYGENGGYDEFHHHIHHLQKRMPIFSTNKPLSRKNCM